MKALRKDFFMQIKRTFNRFISILLIVALGVSFYAGIRSTEPDMRLSADAFYDGNKMMDIRIISTLGLKDYDVEAIRGVKGVECAIGTYTEDVIMHRDEHESSVKIMGETTDINLVTIKEGRMPENVNECIVDVQLSEGDYQIGDKVTFDTDSVKDTEYTIVGYFISPLYISRDKGTTNVGNGKLSGVVVLNEDAFDLDYYTDIFVSVKGAKDLISASDEYENLVDEVSKRIKDEVQEDCIKTRFDSLVEDANEEIAKGEETLDEKQQEYDDGVKEVEDGNKEIAKNEEKLKDAQKEIEENESTLAQAKDEINEGEEKLSEAKSQLEENKKSIAKALEQYNAGLEEYNEGLKAYKAGLKEYKSGLKEYKSGRKAYKSGLKSYKAGLKEYEDGLEEYNTGYSQYNENLSEYNESKGTFDENLQNYKDGVSAYEEALLMYEQGVAAYGEEAMAKTKAELDVTLATLDATKSALDEGEAELSKWKTELDKADKQLKKSKKQLYTAKKTLDKNKKTLDATKVKLDKAKTKLNKAKKTLNKSKEKLDEAKKTLDSTKEKIEEGESAIAKGEAAISSSEQELSDAKSQYESGVSEISDAKTKVSKGLDEIETAKSKIADANEELDEGSTKLAEAKQDLEDAKAKVSDIAMPEWYVLDRNYIESYVEYDSDASRIGNIGKVFPIFFFLVAAMVCLTTMTRMVEEERTQIGTMKALGYNKIQIAMKYLLYGFLATIVGGVAGGLLGSRIFPSIIINAYGIMFSNLETMVTPINIWYFASAILIAVVSITAATLISCINELRATPATLMRPAAPKLGKKVLLERIPFIWNHLSFNYKSTFRNLFRYKKRLFMTLFGIGGCMALMLVGFGVKDSINTIVDKQFGDISKYDMVVTYDSEAEEDEVKDIKDFFTSDNRIDEYLDIYETSTECYAGKKSYNCYIYVPEDGDKFLEYFDFRDRLSGEKYTLADDGIMMDEKLASLLNVKVGDNVEVEDEDGIRYQVRVAVIYENYAFHYLYMTPDYYREIFGTDPDFNASFVKNAEGYKDYNEELSAKLLGKDAVGSVSFLSTTRDTVDSMLGSMDVIIVVLVVCAGALAFIVLYNLNNVNIAERRRELATLKVLGFHDKEVTGYICRENIIITIMGMALGAVFGKYLHLFVMVTAEIDSMMFGRDVKPISYLYSILLTILFAIIINLAMHFKLKKVDMATSLKSVE